MYYEAIFLLVHELVKSVLSCFTQLLKLVNSIILNVLVKLD